MRVVSVIVVLSMAVSALRRRYTIVVVRGHSMNPTLVDGQRVLAARRRQYRTGDIVVFPAPDPDTDTPWRIKRVVAVAGGRGPWPDLPAVPNGHLAVAGDGVRSQDSRQLGFIPVGAVLGCARTPTDRRHWRPATDRQSSSHRRRRPERDCS